MGTVYQQKKSTYYRHVYLYCKPYFIFDTLTGFQMPKRQNTALSFAQILMIGCFTSMVLTDDIAHKSVNQGGKVFSLWLWNIVLSNI